MYEKLTDIFDAVAVKCQMEVDAIHKSTNSRGVIQY